MPDIWDELEQKYEQGKNIKGEVIRCAKGGLIIDVGGSFGGHIEAYLPGSHIAQRLIKNVLHYRMIGGKYCFKIIDFQKNRKNIVVSRKLAKNDYRRDTSKKTIT